ncbi:hypothetical protein TUBRATIS_20010 [Tubulinosema ratisbonensis]|uniref:Uncharacterized protein n=1 Tax=Tubulinosema ratisbonensis TaxID=291195 RepID=A0A437AKA1_9MICR|nr:hypothetical protein TUBRATIS_20010 [Tubulinosema ratisbonensis]
MVKLETLQKQLFNMLKGTEKKTILNPPSELILKPSIPKNRLRKNLQKAPKVVQTAESKAKYIDFIEDSLVNIIYYTQKHKSTHNQNDLNKINQIIKNLVETILIPGLNCMNLEKMEKKLKRKIRRSSIKLNFGSKNITEYKIAIKNNRVNNRKINRFTNYLFKKGYSLCNIESDSGKRNFEKKDILRLKNKLTDSISKRLKKRLNISTELPLTINDNRYKHTEPKTSMQILPLETIKELNDFERITSGKLLSNNESSNQTQEVTNILGHSLVASILILIAIICYYIFGIKKANKRNIRV